MFGMLRGVTEVVSGVTVTVEDHEIMSLGVRPGHCLLMTISPLIGCYLPISGWHWHQAPGLSLDHYLWIWSQSQHLGQKLKLIHFVGDAEFYHGFIFVVRGVPAFLV